LRLFLSANKENLVTTGCGATNKLIRFAEIKTFPNVFQYPVGIQGKWKDVFKNDNPITLELACGKGEYAVGMGRMFPNDNFLGIDMKGNRIWVGAKTALAEGLQNTLWTLGGCPSSTAATACQRPSAIWIGMLKRI
jgi:tRNA (guanine-N7-)-methyltransferase